MVKMMRACINETTRYVRVSVKLRYVAYAPICCFPHMAINCHNQRGSKEAGHTEPFLLVEDVNFLFL
jgi:hypothetical protein